MIEHANQTIVGFYQKNKNFGFVVPDNQKINADVFIPQGKDMGAVTGHKVVVRLTDFGGERKKPEGIITEIIGHVNDPGNPDILSIVKAYGIPDEYPPEVMKQVSRIPDEVAKEDMAGRKDTATGRPSPSTARMPRTWTTPSPSAGKATATSWASTLRMSVIM